MFIYFNILFILILSILYPKKISENIQLFILLFFLGIYIGLRDNVGGDWLSYIQYYNIIDNSENLYDIIFISDPIYVLINYISSFFNGGVYLVNYICGLIFLYGLFYFIREFKLNFSLSIFIAYPYIITIIALGYTRQSVALGFLMIAISLLNRLKKGKAFIFLILAILSHKTAIFGIIFFIEGFSVFWMIVIFILLYSIYIIFNDMVLWMYKIYILDLMQSSGGFIRLFILFILSILFFKFAQKWKVKYNDYKLFSKMALINILFFILIIITGATTLFDRISLYLYPFQMVVLSRVLFLIKGKYIRIIFMISILAIYSLMLFVWMLYSVNSYAWVPYNNILFELF